MNNLFYSVESVFLLKIVLSVIAGGLIGLERYQNGHPAGMRTFAIICLTSTLLTASLGYGMYGQAMGERDAGASRVIQGILQGIGFIGAGVIVRDGLSIKGLTSAASIWAVSSIGILIGTSAYFVAALGTIFIALILITFRKLDMLSSRRIFSHIEISFNKNQVPTEQMIANRLKEFGLNVGGVSYQSNTEKIVSLKIDVWSKKDSENSRALLANDLLKDPNIISFELRGVGE